MDKPVTAEYKFGKAVVRVHGEPDMDNFKNATVQFMKKVREERTSQDMEVVLAENAKRPTKKRLHQAYEEAEREGTMWKN